MRSEAEQEIQQPELQPATSERQDLEEEESLDQDSEQVTGDSCLRPRDFNRIQEVPPSNSSAEKPKKLVT